MNLNILINEATTVKNHINTYLDCLFEKKQMSVIAAAFEQANTTLENFKKQFPQSQSILREMLITSFPNKTDFQGHIYIKLNKPLPSIPNRLTSMTQLKKNIFLVDPSPTFRESIESKLAQIEATSIGRRLLEKISNLSHSVFIKESNRDCCIPSQGIRGVACSVTIEISSNKTTYFTENLTVEVQPPFVTLAHELIHAYHFMRGKTYPEVGHIDPYIWTNEEEFYTIWGLPSDNQERSEPKISENALLRELGMPIRITHLTDSTNFRFFDSRIRLVAKAMERAKKGFCNTENLCPPIINLTSADLEPSTTVVRIFATIDGSGKQVFTKCNNCENSFTFRSIPYSDWTPQLCGPFLNNLTGIYDVRLSLFEAAALSRAKLEASKETPSFLKTLVIRLESFYLGF